MTEDESRSRPSSDVSPLFTPAPAVGRLPLETRIVALAVSVGVCTRDAHAQMPRLPSATVHRCSDAALALEHACRLLVDALGREELAADERAIVAEQDRILSEALDRDQGEEP